MDAGALDKPPVCARVCAGVRAFVDEHDERERECERQVSVARVGASIAQRKHNVGRTCTRDIGNST